MSDLADDHDMIGQIRAWADDLESRAGTYELDGDALVVVVEQRHGRSRARLAIAAAAVLVTAVGTVAIASTRDPDPPAEPAQTVETVETVAPVTTVPVPRTGVGVSQGSAVVSPDSPQIDVSAVEVATLNVDGAASGDDADVARITFQTDGSLFVLDRRAHVASVYERDGTTRWSVDVLAQLGGGDLWMGAVGPDEVLYVSYRDADGYSLAAVATSADRAGVVLQEWVDLGQCEDCGLVTLDRDGVAIGYQVDNDDLFVTAPYLAQDGTLSGAVHQLSPSVITGTREPPPALPPGYVADPDNPDYGSGELQLMTRIGEGDIIQFWQVTAHGATTVNFTFWSFDSLPDGTAIGTINTSKLPGIEVHTLVVARPSGQIEQYRLPADRTFVDFTEIDGRLYAAEARSATNDAAVVRFDP